MCGLAGGHFSRMYRNNVTDFAWDQMLVLIVNRKFIQQVSNDYMQKHGEFSLAVCIELDEL
jgi:hypothetical protein